MFAFHGFRILTDSATQLPQRQSKPCKKHIFAAPTQTWYEELPPINQNNQSKYQSIKISINQSKYKSINKNQPISCAGLVGSACGEIGMGSPGEVGQECETGVGCQPEFSKFKQRRRLTRLPS